jgi:hypothetical protein
MDVPVVLAEVIEFTPDQPFGEGHPKKGKALGELLIDSDLIGGDMPERRAVGRLREIDSLSCRLSGGGGSYWRTRLRPEFPLTGKNTGKMPNTF